MRHAPIIGAALIAAVAFGPVGAAHAASAGTAAKPGAKSTQAHTGDHAALNANSKKFVDTLAISDKYEIDAAGIAQMRSQSDDVKMFAQKMITDHTMSTNQLKSTLMQIDANVTLPSDVDAQHMKMINALQNAGANNFDNVYIGQQVQAHRTAVNLLKNYAAKGGNEQLKMFASMTLPTIQMHLSMIESIQKAHRGNAQAQNAPADNTRSAQNVTNKNRTQNGH